MKYLIKDEMLSLSEIAKKYDIPLNTLYQRAYRGKTGEELTLPVYKRKDKKTVIYKGEEITLTELSEITGLTRNGLARRIQKGQVGEELSRPKYLRTNTGIDYKGVRYSVTKFAELFTNYKMVTVYAKLKKGQTPEEIIEDSKARESN